MTFKVTIEAPTQSVHTFDQIDQLETFLKPIIANQRTQFKVERV